MYNLIKPSGGPGEGLQIGSVEPIWITNDSGATVIVGNVVCVVPGDYDVFVQPATANLLIGLFGVVTGLGKDGGVDGSRCKVSFGGRLTAGTNGSVTEGQRLMVTNSSFLLSPLATAGGARCLAIAEADDVGALGAVLFNGLDPFVSLNT